MNLSAPPPNEKAGGSPIFQDISYTTRNERNESVGPDRIIIPFLRSRQPRQAGFTIALQEDL